MRPFKYTILQDKNWLYQKHVVEKISCRQIAGDLGIKSHTSVRDALRRFNIPTSRPRRYAPKGLSSYPKLNDIPWLKEQYIDKQRDLNDLASEVGCSSGVIRSMLVVHGIKIRGRTESYVSREKNGDIIFTNEAWDIINGSLLGDGGLRKTSASDLSNVHFDKSNIHLEHIELVAKCLFGENYKNRIRGPLYTKNLAIFKNGRRIKSSQPFFTLNSLVHKELTDIYELWYKNGKKTVPKNISISPTVLLHWFMDDGYSYYHGNSIKIFLCSQSFSLSDQNLLRKILFANFGIKTSIIKKENHFLIAVNSHRKNVETFYKTIGKCPINCFQYKWKIHKNNIRLDKWNKNYLEFKNYVLKYNRLPLVKDKKLYLWAREQRYINSGRNKGNWSKEKKEILSNTPHWKW